MATKQKSLGPESKRESRSFPSGGSFFICFDCSFCLCAAAKERASVLFRLFACLQPRSSISQSFRFLFCIIVIFFLRYQVLFLLYYFLLLLFLFSIFYFFFFF